MFPPRNRPIHSGCDPKLRIVATLLALQRQILAAVRAGEGWDEVEAASREVIAADAHALSDNQKDSFGDLGAYIDTVVQQTLQPARTPWCTR